MTGNLARGTGCSGTTSVDVRLVFADVRKRSVGRTIASALPAACATPTAAAAARPAPRMTTNGSDHVPAQATEMARIGLAGKCRSRPVSRILSAFAMGALAGAHATASDDHSSRPGLLAGSSDLPGGLGRAVRRAPLPAPTPPYLVLLRAGFCLPPTLPPARCALTAPFHPYLAAPLGPGGRYVFCATVRQVALPGRYPAHCPSEFGLSSPSGTSRHGPRFPEAAIV